MKRTTSGGLHRTAALALSRTLLLGGLVGAGIVAAPSAAQAQASNDVFYVDLAPLGRDASDSVARRINESLKQNLQTVRVKFTSDLLSAKAGSSGNAGIDEATSDYSKGIGLIAVGDFNGAAELLTTALDKFKKNASELGDAAPIVDATFKLAEAQFKANDQEMARSTLFKALALNPAGEALESSGQAYKQFFDSVRSGMSRNGKGSLTVQTTPAGLAVSVDGQPRGNGPVTLEDLPVGDHWVTVAGEGGQFAGQVIGVQRGRTALAKVDIGRSGGGGGGGVEPRYLRSLRSEVAGGAIDDGLLPYMKELTSRQGAKFVVVGVVVKRADGFEALTFVYRAEDGLFANGPKQKFNKELSNVSSGAYSLAAGVANTLQRFPSTDLVKGTPILPPEAIAPVVAAPVAVPLQPAAAPMMAIPTYEPPAPVAVVAPPAPAAPAPASKPVPAAPAYTPPPAPAAPAYVAPKPAPAPAAPAYTPPPAPAYAPPKPAAPAYGQAPAYGTPAPAYGQAPAYGTPAPAYGQAPAYGTPAPAYGQAPAYGTPAPAYGQAPAYGTPAPAYGQAPSYGTPAPAYGQAPAYGTPAPAYGQAPAYGTPAPAYGQAPAYGTPAPAYGQAPAYGTPAPAYGQAPAYGTPAPAYGQAPAYGTPAPAYAAPAPAYAAPAPAYPAPSYGAQPGPNAGYPSANYTSPGQLPVAEPDPEPAAPDIYGDLMEEPSESFLNKPVVWYSAAGVVAATVLTVVLMQPDDAPATTARPILSW